MFAVGVCNDLDHSTIGAAPLLFAACTANKEHLLLYISIGYIYGICLEVYILHICGVNVFYQRIYFYVVQNAFIINMARGLSRTIFI